MKVLVGLKHPVDLETVYQIYVIPSRIHPLAISDVVMNLYLFIHFTCYHCISLLIDVRIFVQSISEWLAKMANGVTSCYLLNSK